MAQIYKRILFVFLTFIISLTTQAQMGISFPVERAVFQRDNSNYGEVKLHGTLEGECDRIEARLVTRVSGQGVSTDWEVIDDNPIGLAYVGKIRTRGGWYSLEVRGIKEETVIAEARVERVGIGEVFIIAGQSNAQGEGSNINANGANDDRVNAFLPNYFDRSTYRYSGLKEYFDDLSFTKVESNTNIGPLGYTAWCYGELGDYLTSRLNVPVLFFNAGFSATSSQNWRDASNGGQAYSEVLKDDFGYSELILPTGAPYFPFKVTLQSINTLLGVRAVLWHQGEHDGLIKASKETYFQNMSHVINQSRTDINNVIPWVVSRASRYLDGPSQAVIDGQNAIISQVPSVWAGPETDHIQPIRYDGAHFSNFEGDRGLSQLASAWNASLSDAFFNQSNPILAKDIISLNHECSTNNLVKVFTNDPYSQYLWSNGSRSQNIISNSGRYSLLVKDTYGNFYRTQSLDLSRVAPAEVPKISGSDDMEPCVGSSLNLQVTNPKYRVLWNIGYVSPSIEINQTGEYSARFITEANCLSSSSSPRKVTFITPAKKPILTFLNGNGNVCEDDSIRVGVANVQGSQILWNTGQTSNEITINKNSGKDINVTLYKSSNCPSEPSDNLVFNFYSKPALPQIEKAGPFHLSSGIQDDELANWYLNDNLLVSNINTPVRISEIGQYRAQAVKNYPQGLVCMSAISNPFEINETQILSGVKVYPNPVSDGKVYISSDSEKSDVAISLFDESGRRLYFENLHNLSIPKVIDFSFLNLSGKYFVKLEYQNQSTSVPMVFVK